MGCGAYILFTMLDIQFLSILRCPFNPSADISQDDNALICTGCKTKFPVHNGIPCFLPDEAVLPEGVLSVRDLPCRKQNKQD